MRNAVASVRCVVGCMLGLAGCGGALGDEDHGPALARPPSMERAGAPIPPDLTAKVAPRHADGDSWAFPPSLATAGPGACAGSSLDSVAAEIRRRFPAVHDIGNYRAGGPRGVPMNAGAPSRPALAPPAHDKVAYLTGLQDEQGFGLVFFKGSACQGEVCADRQFWYFETDDSCRPRWVGYHNTVERPGGRHGTCVDVRGPALWGLPENPNLRTRCDTNWTAQDISGTRLAWSLAPGATCGNPDGFVPVGLAITQDPTRAQATVTVTGTGIDFIDGVTFAGQVERQHLTSTVTETTVAGCPVRRELRFDLDFEPPTQYGLPGAFGVIDVKQTADGPCATPVPSCTASLHLIPRD